MQHKTQAAILRTAWAQDAAKTMLKVVQAITKQIGRASCRERV